MLDYKSMHGLPSGVMNGSICFLLVLFLVGCTRLTGAPLPLPTDDPAARDAAQTLKTWLAEAGVPEGEQPRILIGQRKAAGWPTELAGSLNVLAEHPSAEAYLVKRGEDGTLYIVAQGEMGLQPAAAGVLHDFGFRWYFPTPHWWVLPHSLAPAREGVFAPVFSRRTLFGTGGMGPGGLPPDPSLKLRDQWNQWLKLNRFGGTVVPTGHAGDHLLQRHREFFVAHPHLRAQIDGKPAPAEKSFHFNYGHPELQRWYVANRLEELARLLEKDPASPGISTDPADGPSPHCQSPESLALGSVSNRVFTLTNLTARAVQERYPGKRVGVNAYNRHAAPPSFPLEPNVYVQVVPYAFNNTGLAPEELLAAWRATGHSMLGVYDYWAITDWALCQPVLDAERTLPEKIRFWHSLGLQGVGVESTFAAGTMGLPVWIASRLLWEPENDEKALAAEFFTQMFGPAQVPMRRMTDRWGGGFQLHAQEIAQSWRDLGEAYELAGADAAVQARVRDYMGYVYYLQLQLEFREAAETGDQLTAAQRWIDGIWQIHDSGMVQSYRMHRLVRRLCSPEVQKALDEQWPVKEQGSPGWQEWRPRQGDWLAEAFADGLKRHPIRFEPAYFSSKEWVEIPSQEPSSAQWITAPLRLGGAKMRVKKGVGEMATVEVKALLYGGKPIPEGNPVQLNVEVNGRVALRTRSSEWEPIPLPAEEGVYELGFRQLGQVAYQVRARPEACLTVIERVESRFPRESFTFYVPPGQRQIALHTPAVPKDGQRVITLQPEGGEPMPMAPGTLKVIEVPAGEGGKIWTVRQYAGDRAHPVTFLNGPRVYGFPGSGILVPKDLTPRPSPN